MKILVFSDIHGSLATAKKITELVKEHTPNHILLLGDILYHGPRNPLPAQYDPAKCISELELFTDYIVAVRGNCDSEVDLSLLSFPVAEPFTWVLADGLRIFATHGHRFTPNELPPLAVGDVFLYGHTHVPAATIHKGIHICNPGTLTNPKEGHPPSFGLFENGVFSVITDTGEVYLRLEGL